MKEKNRFLLLAWGWCMAALLGLGGCSPEAKPEVAGGQFLEYWENAAYEEMYSLLDTAAREDYRQDEFIERYENISRGLRIYQVEASIKEEEVQDLEEGLVEIPFQVTLYTHTVDEITEENTMQLQQNQEGDWKINWSPVLIFPELEGEKEVRVNRQEPERGEVLDRHGNPLAHYAERYEIGIKAGSYDDEDTLVKGLAPLLNMDPEEIEDALQQEWIQDGHFVPLKVLSPGEEELLKEILELGGVIANRTVIRTYPESELFASTLGYLGEISQEELEEEFWEKGYSSGDQIGKTGLKKTQEHRLGGKPGFKAFIQDPDGDEVAVIGEREVQDGENVNLTLDIDIQRQARQVLEDKNGAVVVINAKSGEILALASRPSFDPNWFIPRIPSEKWQKIEEDPDSPLHSRPLRASFPPGSTYKPFTALEALEEEEITSEEELAIEGEKWQADSSWGEYHVTRVNDQEEQVDMKKSLIYSDNIYFARLALKLGKNAILEKAARLGFEEEIPFELPVQESRLTGDEQSFASDIELAASGFGQAKMLTSPLHLAMMYTALTGEEGTIPVPRILKNEDYRVWKDDLYSKANLEEINQILLDNLENPDSPSHEGALEDFTLAGKTGTAETDTLEKNACWYATYTLEEQAPLAVVVMVEDEKWASKAALPRGKQVMEEALIRYLEDNN